MSKAVVIDKDLQTAATDCNSRWGTVLWVTYKFLQSVKKVVTGMWIVPCFFTELISKLTNEFWRFANLDSSMWSSDKSCCAPKLVWKLLIFRHQQACNFRVYHETIDIISHLRVIRLYVLCFIWIKCMLSGNNFHSAPHSPCRIPENVWHYLIENWDTLDAKIK